MKVDREIHWHDQSFVTDPRNLATVSVYRDFWWITNDEGQVAIYGKHSAQCNMNRAIAERFAALEGASGVTQIPLAFVEIDVRDYV